MFKFIWNSWWRNKERFILLLIGVLILSLGLSYLIGITQENNGTVVEELQKRWKASYHIIVRPQGIRAVTEASNLLEPNYLSGLEGGISLAQYETIKKMGDVAVAAPIAMIGSSTSYVEIENPSITESGLYRMSVVEETNTGPKVEKTTLIYYIALGDWPNLNPVSDGIYLEIPSLTYGTNVMIAGIDPEAEAKLLGIDQAIVTNDNSRYFNNNDISEMVSVFEGIEDIQIPVIVSNRAFVDSKVTYSFEKLDIPFEKMDKKAAIDKIRLEGGKAYLDKLTGTSIKDFKYTTNDIHKRMIEKIFNPYYEGVLRMPSTNLIAFKPSTVNYKIVKSPYETRWPFAYEVIPSDIPKSYSLFQKRIYRQFNPYSEDSKKWPRLRMNFIGVFDPQNLQISKDPMTELPMETYFPANAQLVLDANKKPINPYINMKPTNNEFGFLTKPPLLLTTIEAAARIIGDKPISAIRVNVKGVETFNSESEELLKKVALEIEQKTGLITDITLGSSPQYALTYLPKLEEGKEAIGWVQQPWIKIGTAISIFHEAKIGFSGIVAILIAVAVVYVFSSNLIMIYARKKEFAILISLGWRPIQLSKVLFLESTILGICVAFISWIILGIFFLMDNHETSGWRIFLVGIFGLTIYWLGTIFPALIVRKIKPYETLKTGEVFHRNVRFVKANSVAGMNINYLLNQWKRSMLSIFSIAIPTNLFTFFLFITFRLKGVMYATWLGEYVALKVSKMHFVAMGVALLIAIITTTEIMWQNIAERKSQIAVLKVIGWKNKWIRLLVLMEGAIIGLIAGIIGIAITLALVIKIYGQFPNEQILFLCGTLIIPIFTGILGALIPAERAVRVHPFQALNGGVSNSKAVEKYFKIILSCLAIALFISSMFVLIFAIQHTKKDVHESLVPKHLEEKPLKAASPETIKMLAAGVIGDYMLNLTLDRKNIFHVSAEIKVKNETPDVWRDIGFYFIPNALTEKNKPDVLATASNVSIISITDELKEDIEYELINNKLLLKLDGDLSSGETAKVKIEYTLKLPENGVRLSKVQDNYYLAQWYPMLAHYNKGWIIEDFDIKGESYHTSYGRYVVNYDLPKEYWVVTSGNDDKSNPSSNGRVEGENIKDFYIALLNPDEWKSKSLSVNDNKLNIFVPLDEQSNLDNMAYITSKAYSFFEEKIGENPFFELDVIGNDGNMEYPNVVEVSIDEHTIVHEIAHQWFYNVISNDPFKDAWLDESLAEFVTAMFLSDKYQDDNIGFQFVKNISESNTPSKFINIPLNEFGENYYSTVYGKGPTILKDFFDQHGGQKEAFQFLSAYYEKFKFKYVDSKTFLNFLNNYYSEGNREFLEKWINIE